MLPSRTAPVVTPQRAWTAAILAVIAAVVGAVALAATSSAQNPPPFAFNRLAGADRYATAAVIATTDFPRGAENVVLASGDNYADALVGDYVAGRLGAPVLLTHSTVLSPAVILAVASLQASHVTIVGGDGAVTAAVQAAVSALRTVSGTPMTVTRIAGSDRYDTARRAAEAFPLAPGRINGQPTAVLVTGSDFGDALAAGPMVVADRFPLLLTASNALSPAAASAIHALGIRHVLIVGGTRAVTPAVEAELAGISPPVSVERLAGATRYATAATVWAFELSTLGFSDAEVDLARGDSPNGYADALGLAAAAGARGPVGVLMSPPSAPVGPTASALRANARTLRGGDLAGGTGAVNDVVADDYEVDVRSAVPSEAGTPTTAGATAPNQVSAGNGGTDAGVPAPSTTTPDPTATTLDPTATGGDPTTTAPPDPTTTTPPDPTTTTPSGPPTTAPPDPPVALNSTYTTVQNAALSVPAPGVLANDTDPSGESLTANLATTTANGVLTLDPDGGFTYTPDTTFTGSDSFAYTATDATGATSTPATVTIDVAAPAPSGPPPPAPAAPAALTTGDGDSLAPAASKDGSVIAYLSAADDIADTPTKTTTVDDVFVTSRSTGATIRVMGADGAEPNGDALSVAITPDGHYAVFTSDATNYIAGDTFTANSQQVYRYAVSGPDAGSIVLVSAVNGSDAPGDGTNNDGATVSADGQTVAFTSNATNLTSTVPNTTSADQVYVRNIAASTTTLVSADQSGAASPGSDAYVSSLSDDGNLVSFETDAPNMSVTTAPTGAFETYVRNMGASSDAGIDPGATVMASVSSGGVAAAAGCIDSRLSPDGTMVVLLCASRNLVANDGTAAGENEIFVHSLGPSASTVRISQTSSGGDPDNDSELTRFSAAISADDRDVVFLSTAGNLVPGGTTGAQNVYVANLTTGAVDLVNLTATGQQSAATSDNNDNVISEDGSTILFASDDPGLPGANGSMQIYVVANPT